MSEELSHRTKHHKPAWRICSRCSSQPLALSRMFILRTSHFTTIYSSSESIYVTVLILAWCFNTRVHTNTQTLVLFLAIFSIFVLITALSLTWAGIYSPGRDPDSELLSRERERGEEAALHLNPSRSGALPGATCQKYILGLKGAEEHAAAQTGAGAVFKNKWKMITVPWVEAPLCLSCSTAPTTSSRISGQSINLTIKLCPLALLLFSIYSWAVVQPEVDEVGTCIDVGVDWMCHVLHISYEISMGMPGRVIAWQVEINVVYRCPSVCSKIIAL